MAIKCSKPIIREENPLSLIITGGTFLIKESIKDDEISSIKLPDGRSLSCGQLLTIKKFPYKINKILRVLNDKIKSYRLITAERTKSSVYILPMLGGDRRLLMYNRQLLNCFIETEEHPYCIALLYKFSGDTMFLKFENALKQFRNFITSYDPSPHHVMFIFSIPSDHLKDYNNFIKGQYSKFSMDYKMKILDFHFIEIDSEVGQILFKDKKRKLRLEEKLEIELDNNAELLSIIDKEKETFDSKIYIYKKGSI